MSVRAYSPFPQIQKRSRKGIKSTNFVIFYGCLNKCLEHDARLYPNLNLPEGYPWQPHRFHRYRQSWCGKKTKKNAKKSSNKNTHFIYLIFFWSERRQTECDSPEEKFLLTYYWVLFSYYCFTLLKSQWFYFMKRLDPMLFLEIN